MDTHAWRERLERAAARRPDYELSPPLHEDEIAAFEREHGVTLPGDYRRFLVEVASGFVNDGAMFMPFAYATKDTGGSLAQPFPYTSVYSARIRARWAESPHASLHDLMQDPSLSADQVQGAMSGCLVLVEWNPEQSVLVVTGDERGRIWRIGPDYDAPEDAHLELGNGDHETLVDFASLIEGWLRFEGM